MSWIMLAQLLIQYGLPFAEMVFQKVNAGGDVTQADLDALKALAKNTAQTQVVAAAIRAGLTTNDPFVLQLLGMVPPAPPTPPVA